MPAADANTHERSTRAREQLRVLRENKWLIISCLVLTLAATIIYTETKTPEYAATAQLFFHQQDVGEQLTGAPQVSEDPDVRAATDLELASLPAVANRVRGSLSQDINSGEILRKVDAKAKANSRLTSITATDEDPQFASTLANTFAREYVAFRREAAQRRYERALALVERQLRAVRRGTPLSTSEKARIRTLRAQAEDLEVIGPLQTGEVEVIQEAGVPTKPFSPDKPRNYVLGGLFGLLLGLALATLRDRFDRRVKSEDQIRDLLPDVPVIASLPSGGRGGRPQALLAEAFRTLQTNLTFLSVDGTLQSVLITSPSVGEGKSTTSLNLALAMSERQDGVMLVDADLRRPRLTEALGLGRERGVSNFLSGHGSSLTEYASHVAVDKSRMNGHGPTAALSGALNVVPAGPVPPNPQALLSGNSLDALLAQARASSSKVVIDGAPLGPFSDSLPIAKRADGVIVVIRLYHSRRDEVERLLDQLDQASINPVGVVVVGGDEPREHYYN